MIDRQSIYYYVGLAALSIIVVFGVVYFSKNMGPQLDPIPRTPVMPTGAQATGKETGAIDHLDRYLENEDRLLSRDYGDIHNPFLWRDELKPEKTDQIAPMPKSVPRLGMIIIGQYGRLAFLDQKLVYEGDQYAGYRVEKIDHRSVTLSYSNGKLQLIAPVDHFGPAEVKRLERSRP